jgi:hypothetical protein
VRNEALFGQCLLEAFDEILALAGDTPTQAVPASFTEPAVSSRSASGS